MPRAGTCGAGRAWHRRRGCRSRGRGRGRKRRRARWGGRERRWCARSTRLRQSAQSPEPNLEQHRHKRDLALDPAFDDRLHPKVLTLQVDVPMNGVTRVAHANLEPGARVRRERGRLRLRADL